jgi:hypothetical protein
MTRSPFGGIPRNWKHDQVLVLVLDLCAVPPSGGSLEIGNIRSSAWRFMLWMVPPSGGSLEIGNKRKPATQ